MNKALYKLISLIALLPFLIVFMTVSCKAAPPETLQTETIPETTADTAPETIPEITAITVEEPKIIAEYTVQSGDTLGQIAKNFYRNYNQPYWELIYEANKDIIKDASLIYPGQVIKIPELPEELKN